MTNLRDAAMTSKAWPFEEARRIKDRYAKKDPKKAMCCLKQAMASPACRILVLLARWRAQR